VGAYATSRTTALWSGIAGQTKTRASIRPAHSSDAPSAAGRPARTRDLVLAAKRGTHSTPEGFADVPPPVDFNPVSLLCPVVAAFGLVGSEVLVLNKDPTGVRFGDNRQYKSTP
jgi:hypothetical protein